MWEQRPPLLPAQLADRAGVSRQLLSRVLNQEVMPDPIAIRALARSMDTSTSALLAVAGYTTVEDPLYAREEVWDVVATAVTSTKALSDDEREHILDSLLRVRSAKTTAHDGAPDLSMDTEPLTGSMDDRQDVEGSSHATLTEVR